MTQTTERSFGQLKVRMVGSPKATRGILLCHGYGAPGTDLVPLAQALMRVNPSLEKDSVFLFPEAPIKLDMGMPWMESRAWWHIDIGRFERAIRTGNLRGLTLQEPDGLAHARGLVQEVIHEATSTLGLDEKQWVIGGFSQGAMLTTDLVLRMKHSPRGLCILSGTLLNATIWEKLIAARPPLNIFQSHGKDDPILPHQVAIWLRDLLIQNKHQVRFSSFEGGHGIPASVLREMGTFLS